MSEPNQLLLHTALDGAVKVEVFFREETIWLTPKALAELFGVKRPACGPVVRLAGDHAGGCFFTGGSYTAARQDL